MYKNSAETLCYLRKLQENTADLLRDEINLFILPSFTSLYEAAKDPDTKFLQLGAQNIAYEEEGQYTGDISARMLEENDIRLVMLGHSERRHVFGETDYEVNKKVHIAVKHNFTALLCVGETETQKTFGVAREVLRQQIKIGFHQLPPTASKNLWVAYEPVWSIGVKGTPASAAYAETMHQTIKNCLYEIFGQKSDDIPVLYGGSVNLDNCEELICQDSIDGLFVGRAAWDADNFDVLIRKALKAHRANGN